MNDILASFPATNESLDAVMRGCDPRESDAILAIGGSGDQAFALLERAGKVVVVENDPSQINLISKRYDALRDGNLEEFMGPESDYTDIRDLEIVRLRNQYFSSPGRFERIQKKADKLTILPSMSLLDFLNGDGAAVDVIYTSNILNYRKWDAQTSQTINHSEGNDCKVLKHLAELKGSRLYFSNGHVFEGSFFWKPKRKFRKPWTFKLDKKRTHLARAEERDSPLVPDYTWKPVVFDVK